jgi:hypothetical protein
MLLIISGASVASLMLTDRITTRCDGWMKVMVGRNLF